MLSGTGSAAFALSLNSTVVNSSSVSPMFSTLWMKNVPAGKSKCLAWIIHDGWRAWRKSLIGHRIRLRHSHPADFGRHARQS